MTFDPQRYVHDAEQRMAAVGASALPVAMVAGAATTSLDMTATPFVWCDPATIPPRRWLYGRHLLRKFVTVTAGAGGSAKTTLGTADAVAMATGRPLMGCKVHEGPLRVWLWNLEDPRDELHRRIAAAVLHHRVEPATLDGRLFLDSGRDKGLCLATQDRAGVTIVEPVVDALVAELTRRSIDVLVVDPSVSSHAVEESDNGAIDAVAKAWGRVAERANCAIELVHHLRKTNGEEATAEHARGAVALIAAARVVRVLQRMTPQEAQKAGLDDEERRALIRVDGTAKANLGPPEKARWVRAVGVALGNGDEVATVEPWNWPDPFDGLTADDLSKVQRALDGQGFRANAQAARWAGHEVGKVLGFDTTTTSGKAKAKRLLDEWLRTGALVVVEARDPKTRQHRPLVSVGEWVGA